jgi:alpha-ketoglutarate-dependent taurine dioxygenase
MPHKPPSVKQQLEACRKWNESHPIGTPVTVELDSGEIRATKTLSQAGMLGSELSRKDPGHTAVIFLEGLAGCYLLSRVRAKGEAHHAA